MPVNMTEEQKEILREFAHLEKDTPGTITGVDKSSFRNFRMRKPSEKQESNDNFSDKTDKTSSESREQSSRVSSDNKVSPDMGTDAKGTLAKIIDAVNENETVKFIKKKIWG